MSSLILCSPDQVLGSSLDFVDLSIKWIGIFFSFNNFLGSGIYWAAGNQEVEQAPSAMCQCGLEKNTESNCCFPVGHAICVSELECKKQSKIVHWCVAFSIQCWSSLLHAQTDWDPLKNYFFITCIVIKLPHNSMKTYRKYDKHGM